MQIPQIIVGAKQINFKKMLVIAAFFVLIATNIIVLAKYLFAEQELFLVKQNVIFVL